MDLLKASYARLRVCVRCHRKLVFDPFRLAWCVDMVRELSRLTHDQLNRLGVFSPTIVATTFICGKCAQDAGVERVAR